ncbi:hypothetical protein [Opitutus terrae]|uniref:Uncharacterized protein n=1 Tax=Opitutus terrae (strain DSM 11246 / JCM 15787 / PB90-1) TaxID=452637 RepID=B1ZXU5_OPITP|nr:hypothetical protein [Opitutus terrae]ACB74313.1 conserved hypothetical protein [Opitutus terrae PB90-1]
MNLDLSEQEVRARLNLALEQLATRDGYLVKYGLNERTVTHKLAEYLQAVFPKWDVDCEYNRDGPDTKDVLIPNVDGDLDDNPVYPDIIVHQRGDFRAHDHPPHLLVIEARKSGWGVGKISRDQWKVWAYLNELRYCYGALVEYAFVDGKVQFAMEFIPRT